MTSSYKNRKTWTQTQAEGREQCEHREGNGIYTAQAKKCLEDAGNDPPLEFSPHIEFAWPSYCLDFRLLDSRTLKTRNEIVWFSVFCYDSPQKLIQQLNFVSPSIKVTL